MKVCEISSGFVPKHGFDNDRELVWINAMSSPFTIHGVFYDEKQGLFVRMPQDVADSARSEVTYLNRNTAGARVRFRTNSKCLACYIVMFNDGETHHVYHNENKIDLSQFDENFGRETYAYSFASPNNVKEGYGGCFGATGEMKDYVFHLPICCEIRAVYVGLSPDAVVEAPTPYKYEKPIVYYGSSITQGYCSSRPSNTYQAVIARHLDADYVSLGFAGNAKGEASIIEYIAGLEMTAFVCDYDHNAPSPEHLQKTHLPIYRIFREKQPTTPIVFVSAPNIMPDYTWHIPRRDVIRSTYETAKAEGDENVYFIDGETFFDIPDREMCTTDTCHPNDLGMYLMSQKIEPVIREILEKK